MVTNFRVMANMISAPKSHVIPDDGERLQSVVFQDQAVFTDLDSRENSRARAYVARKGVAHRFASLVFFFAKLIQL